MSHGVPKSVQSKPKVETLVIKSAPAIGPSLSMDDKFEEVHDNIRNKIEKELTDAQNGRDYIAMKYDELCNKIQYLTEMDATVSGFRTDVKAIEQQIARLSARVDDIEKRTIFKECPSLPSSN